MRRRWVILMALLACAQVPGFAAGMDQPNFAGKWKADVAECEFGMEPVPESLVYRVEQKGLTLTIERVKQKNGNETKIVRTVEASSSTARRLSLNTAQTLKATTLTSSRDGKSPSADGNDLTVFRSISAAGGGTDQKLVFHK